ncbi:MAG: hypothetical protein HY543_09110 [Deltaproteobacteria bacterium]|nr:hypothetical protein [Deltaproteobacteria bacterium]
MKEVPLKELKSNLSFWAEKASKGDLIQITKYNRPYMLVGPSRLDGLVVGSRVGVPLLRPALKAASKGKWLRRLQEDRDDPDTVSTRG